MSSTTSQPKSVLPALYTSGKHSDLIVRTQDGREFRVHKCIVSSKSGFFDGVCRGNFKEAQSGVVKVEESGEVMDALFRHMYDTAIKWVPQATHSVTELKSRATAKTFELAKKVRVAADKYLISGLERSTDLAVCNCFKHGDISSTRLVMMCISCLDDGIDVGSTIRFKVLKHLVDRFTELLRDAELWSLLSSQETCLKATVECAVLATHWQALPEGTARANAAHIDLTNALSVYAWRGPAPPTEETLDEIIISVVAVNLELARED